MQQIIISGSEFEFISILVWDFLAAFLLFLDFAAVFRDLDFFAFDRFALDLFAFDLALDLTSLDLVDLDFFALLSSSSKA